MNNAEAVVEKLIRRQEAEDTTVLDDLVADDFPDFLTAMLADPDGARIELVQWPPGHADGMSAADFRRTDDIDRRP